MPSLAVNQAIAAGGALIPATVVDMCYRRKQLMQLSALVSQSTRPFIQPWQRKELACRCKQLASGLADPPTIAKDP
jgi:hypothetical protein